MKNCENAGEHRSTPCLPVFIFSKTGPGATAQPVADPGGEDLRERPEVDDEPSAVERAQRRQRVALVAQEAVGVVLEDEQLALGGDLHEAPAARERHRHAAGVLERRDGVDELRAPALGLQAVERRLELVDEHPVAVHRDLHDVGLVGGERRDRAGVGRRLGDDDVAGIDERLADEVDDLLAAGRDEDVGGVDLRALRGHHLDDRLAHAPEPLGGRVLQRLGRRLGGDAAHELGEQLRREARRVRLSAGQRDDVRALRDRHEIAHGGGRHPAGALGEQPCVAFEIALCAHQRIRSSRVDRTLSSGIMRPAN